MRLFEDVCPRCQTHFTNNSVATSFGCADCEAWLRAEEHCLRVFGKTPKKCYFIVAGGDPCGTPAPYAAYVQPEPVPENLRTSCFCFVHFPMFLAGQETDTGVCQ